MEHIKPSYSLNDVRQNNGHNTTLVIKPGLEEPDNKPVPQPAELCLRWLEGSYDLHVHSAPDLIARRYTDLEIAQRASQHHMSGVMIKSHVETTVGRAFVAQKASASTTKLYGGLVLNDFAGGINLNAIKNSLSLGAKIVWMPTVDSSAHIRRSKQTKKPWEVWSDELLRMVCKLVASHGAALATGHIAPWQIKKLLPIAASQNTKLIITHPDFFVPDFSPEQQKALALKYDNLFFERCAYSYVKNSPAPRSFQAMIKALKITGPNNFLSSDLGQPENPSWPKGFAWFINKVHNQGISENRTMQMIKDVPQTILEN